MLIDERLVCKKLCCLGVFNKVDLKLLAQKFIERISNKDVVDCLFGLVLIRGRGGRTADDERQAIGNIVKGDFGFVLCITVVCLEVFIQSIGKGKLYRLIGGTAVLKITGVVVIFQKGNRVGNAEGDICLEFVFVKIGSITSLCFDVPRNGSGQTLVANLLQQIVGNTVFINEFFLGKGFVLLLNVENKGCSGVDHCLTVQGVAEELGGNIDVGKDLEVGAPKNDRTRAFFFRGERSFLQFTVDLAAAEADTAFYFSVVGFDNHIFRSVLRCARTKTVQAEGVFVCAATAVVFVFTACIKLTVNQIPVPATFGLVPSERNTASVVVNFNASVLKNGNLNFFTVSGLSLVNRVGENFKEGMLASFKSVRAENNRGALSNSVGAFEGFYTLIVILLRVLLLCSHWHSSFRKA